MSTVIRAANVVTGNCWESMIGQARCERRGDRRQGIGSRLCALQGRSLSRK